MTVIGPTGAIDLNTARNLSCCPLCGAVYDPFRDCHEISMPGLTLDGYRALVCPLCYSVRFVHPATWHDYIRSLPED